MRRNHGKALGHRGIPRVERCLPVALGQILHLVQNLRQLLQKFRLFGVCRLCALLDLLPLGIKTAVQQEGVLRG